MVLVQDLTVERKQIDLNKKKWHKFVMKINGNQRIVHIILLTRNKNKLLVLVFCNIIP